MRITAIQCDFCGYESSKPSDFAVQMSMLDLHFCDERERDRYAEEAPPGERAAVLEELAANHPLGGPHGWLNGSQ